MCLTLYTLTKFLSHKRITEHMLPTQSNRLAYWPKEAGEGDANDQF